MSCLGVSAVIAAGFVVAVVDIGSVATCVMGVALGGNNWLCVTGVLSWLYLLVASCS